MKNIKELAFAGACAAFAITSLTACTSNQQVENPSTSPTEITERAPLTTQITEPEATEEDMSITAENLMEHYLQQRKELSSFDVMMITDCGLTDKDTNQPITNNVRVTKNASGQKRRIESGKDYERTKYYIRDSVGIPHRFSKTYNVDNEFVWNDSPIEPWIPIEAFLKTQTENNYYDCIKNMLENPDIYGHFYLKPKTEMYNGRSCYVVECGLHQSYVNYIDLENVKMSLGNDFTLYDDPIEVTFYFDVMSFKCIGEKFDATNCTADILKRVAESADAYNVNANRIKYVVEKRDMNESDFVIPKDVPLTFETEKNEDVKKAVFFPYKDKTKSLLVKTKDNFVIDTTTESYAVVRNGDKIGNVVEMKEGSFITSQLKNEEIIISKENMESEDYDIRIIMVNTEQKKSAHPGVGSNTGCVLQIAKKGSKEGLYIIARDKDNAISIAQNMTFA